MDFSRNSELLEGLVHQLIDEEALGVCFEMHRAIKLDYYDLLYHDRYTMSSEVDVVSRLRKPKHETIHVYEKHDIVDVKGLDIFGNSPACMKKCVDCVCPNCNRTLGAQKFAPHLEKCMGMGRNSSRLANRKNKTPVDSDQEVSDDNEDEWTYPERKPTSKNKKDKLMTISPRKPGARGPGRPPKHASREQESTAVHLKPSLQQHNTTTFSALPAEYKQSLLQQICGVVSERTGRLCTRSVNCPQHSEDQRQDVRRQLLFEHSLDPLPPAKRARESLHRSQEDDLDVESHFDSILPPHLPDSSPSSDVPHIPSRKRKMKSGKRSKKGHGTVTTSTVLHSSGHNF